MDYLREGIGLRGLAQIDPLVAYKNEGFEMFTALMNSIWEEFARYIFRVEVQIEGENGNAGQQQPDHAQPWAASSNASSTRNFSYAGGTAADQPSAIAAAAAAEGAAMAGEEGAELLPHVETRHVDEHDRIGRNDPCWCGSGKKFKKCHGAG
jgi:preprotein translocase subunit SecA